MMGVYIKGMEMPNISDYNGINCCLYKTLGGQLRLRNNETGEFFDVIPVPPHGRLIDAEEAKEILKPEDSIARYEPEWTWGEIYEINCNEIDKLPTIIPAEEVKES